MSRADSPSQTRFHRGVHAAAPDDFEIRFGGIGRLVGTDALARLRSARVAVVGLGGVGSWAVEALARSGIGHLTLIDLDEVCLSNVNRQLPALDGTLGRFKAEVLAERVRAIHPSCQVDARIEFFTEASSERLLSGGYSAVVDAIDAVANKCRLIAACRARNLPVIVCGGAGGRLDPTRLREADLADVTHDRLLAEVRRRLRHEQGFAPAGKRMKVPAIFSDESPVIPRKDGSVCEAHSAEAKAEDDEIRRLNCDWGYGSATFVTGAFGFAAAAWVIRHIARAASTDPGIPPTSTNCPA
jgi:tRNA A37 threonylcarbamoyladenosine dehydratase